MVRELRVDVTCWGGNDGGLTGKVSPVGLGTVTGTLGNTVGALGQLGL